MPSTNDFKFKIGEILVEVEKKDIKNLHLSVYPPSGKVKMSVPLRMKKDTIRAYAISKLDWIKKQRKKLQEQDRETVREYLNRESHYVWGKRYLLKVVEEESPPQIEIKHNSLILTVRPRSNEAKKQEVLERWFREQLKEATTVLISKWEPLISVKVKRFFVQRMKTKWGSCSASSKSIRLNSELAKKPRECLEYIVVHEMVHLRERTHNRRFILLMDHFMPRWRFYRDELNRQPLRHENWEY